MLKQRLLTALVLAGVFLPALIWLPEAGIALLFGVITALGAREWAVLAGCDRKGSYAYVLLLMLLLAGLYVLQPVFDLVPLVVVLGLALWGYAILHLLVFRRKGVTPASRSRKLITGLMVLSIGWFSLWQLRLWVEGPWLLLYLLFLIWIADSGAFFAGRTFGRHKLAPAISPGKTLEGVYGGLLVTGIFAAGVHFFAAPVAMQGIWFVLLSVVVAFISVFGDLMESLLKRQAGVKDSGCLLPGHGGVLDRVDSLLAAAPAMLTGLWLLG